MKTRHDQIMWNQLFSLSTDSGLSLQRQIREMLVSAILDGHITPDTPLPSCRELARQLNVARNTVVLAYQHLMDEGYIVSQERSGYFVNPHVLAGRVDRKPPTSQTSAPNRSGPVWSQWFRVTPTCQRNIEKPHDWQRYDYPFIYGQLDPALLPIHDWRECCRQALSVREVRDLAHDRVDADDPLLVEQLHTRLLPRRGVWASEDEILITLGTQNALYLLAALLVSERSRVGVEDPGYPDVRNIMSLKTSRLVGLPVDELGLVVDKHLDHCDLICTTPSHQSPTTVTLPLERRQALLERAAARDMILIEDDYESEINFLGDPAPALKSLDNEGRVIYVGSLSKTLDPGLRIGYLVGPAELIQQARALRRLMYRHPPTNNQRIVALFLALGHHDALIQRLSQAYKARWQAMGEALDRYFPDSVRGSCCGGSAYWVRGPGALDARELQRQAARQGILIEAGDVYFMAENRPLNYFRLGFSAIPVERIEPGIRKLAALVDELVEMRH